MARKKVGARVFLSYTKADAALARLLVLEIEQVKGASVFSYLRDRTTTDSARRRIKAEMEKCTELLLILTPQSRKQMYVSYEVGLADGRDLPISVALFYLTHRQLGADRGALDFLRERAFDLNTELDRYLEDLKGRCDV